MLEWYKDWDNWTPPTREMLPLSSSFVITLNEVPVAITSYYETNSSLAMLGATIKSRKHKDMVTKEDIVDLMRVVKEDAIKKGFNVLFYATDEESKHMVKNFEEAGGIITDKGDAWIASMPLEKDLNIDWLKE